MRWTDDFSENWEDVPDDPPTTDRRATAVELGDGFSILDDTRTNAWVYVDDGAVVPEP